MCVQIILIFVLFATVIFTYKPPNIMKFLHMLFQLAFLREFDEIHIFIILFFIDFGLIKVIFVLFLACRANNLFDMFSFDVFVQLISVWKSHQTAGICAW